MKRRIKTNLTSLARLALTVVATLLLALSPAATSAQRATANKVKVDFKEVTLKNGLRVITVEDHLAPVVSVALTYRVGAANEREGLSGFAHLLEHMMFRGTRNVKAEDYMNLVFGNGGNINASTGTDVTFYFAAVPANQLDLPLFLEADRMRGLLITQAVLDTESNVVQEERRLRIDNQPYGKSRWILNGMLYDNFPYHHDPIGSIADLKAAKVADVTQFFDTYYVPNIAVLVLVGDFKTEEGMAKVRKYFDSVPRQGNPPPVDLREPEQQAERRQTVEDELARAPQVSIGFKAASGNTQDLYALQILSEALSSGQSSRLYQKLVKEKELVGSVTASIDERKGPSALYITATLRPGKKTEEVETAIYEEIERVRREPLSDAEMEKAKNTTALAFITKIQTSLLRAIFISLYAAYFDDPNLINTWLDKTAAVTKEDVARVAKKYLRPTNRTVVITLPKAKGASDGPIRNETLY